MNSPRTIAIAFTALLTAVLVFHALILSGVIPYEITWGGRLKSHEEMVVFETISIAFNLLFMGIIALHLGWIRWRVRSGVTRIALIVMGVLFALNTLGNLFAEMDVERWIFTPLTAISSFWSFSLARYRKELH